MAQADYELSVSIERDTNTLDDYGGETASSSTVAAGLRATKHYYSRQGLERLEGAAQSGPGLLTKTKVFFKFQQPHPDVRINDRIVEEVSTDEWLVMHVRTYARTMQVDCEIVE